MSNDSKVGFKSGSEFLRRLADFCEQIKPSEEQFIQGIIESSKFRDYVMKTARNWPAHAARLLIDGCENNSLLKTSANRVFAMKEAGLPFEVNTVNFFYGDKTRGYSFLMPGDLDNKYFAVSAERMKTANYPNIAFVCLNLKGLPPISKSRPSLLLVIQFCKDELRADLYRLIVDGEGFTKYILWRKFVENQLHPDDCLRRDLEETLYMAEEMEAKYDSL